jgi:hypothetical protein
MSGEGVATERREAEFKVEANSEEALIVLLLAWFKSQMINCELAYQQGDKRALMTALQICFGVWLPAGRSPEGPGEGGRSDVSKKPAKFLERLPARTR